MIECAETQWRRPTTSFNKSPLVAAFFLQVARLPAWCMHHNLCITIYASRLMLQPIDAPCG